jgi:hypothetical protein
MKDSEILKNARELIAAGKEDSVCDAITACSSRPGIQINQGEILITWAKGMLEGLDTLSIWLLEKHGIHCHFDNSIDGPIRNLRLRWLDWMIQYCELEEAGWTPWLGGETPPETCSVVMFRDGFRSPAASQLILRWTHINRCGDIIAYKP